MRFLATVSKGLEEVTAAELRGLGLPVLEISPGLVAFKGKPEDAWKACLWLRSARRVLLPLGTFRGTRRRRPLRGGDGPAVAGVP